MGRLIPTLLLAGYSSMTPANGVPDGIPQQHKDAIREYHTKQIMRSGQNLTILQPDVELARKSMAPEPRPLDTRQLPEPDPIPFAQIFKATDLNLGQIVSVAAAASGYDVSWHPQVDQRQKVLINSHPNSLTDIAEYLSRVTTSTFAVYPESRVLVALPKESRHD